MKTMMNVSKGRGEIGSVMPMKVICSAVFALVLVTLTSVSRLLLAQGK